MNTKTKGDAGEDRAALYLEEKGFKIIARKWRTRSGEIDIIAEKDDYLVFFEVKTLPKGTNDMLLRELNQEKQQRILKTSKRFLLSLICLDILRFIILKMLLWNNGMGSLWFLVLVLQQH